MPPIPLLPVSPSARARFHGLISSLTGMLARMESAGLVRRAKSPEDARRSVVSATGDGLALAASLRTDIEAQYQDLEAHMSQPKLAQLYKLLDELIDLHPTEDEETDDMEDQPGKRLTETAA